MRNNLRIATMLCFVALAVGTADVGDAAIAPPQQPVERRMILAMARDYRQASNDAWLETVVDAIYEESIRAGVDPLLVAAIIATESSFRDRAVSSAGAVGLMQIRPFVADDVAERMDFAWSKPDSLCSPTVNVRLGVQYYKELHELFDGDIAKALTAYNFGPSAVRRQIENGTYSGSSYAMSILSLYGRLGIARSGDA